MKHSKYYMNFILLFFIMNIKCHESEVGTIDHDVPLSTAITDIAKKSIDINLSHAIDSELSKVIEEDKANKITETLFHSDVLLSPEEFKKELDAQMTIVNVDKEKRDAVRQAILNSIAHQLRKDLRVYLTDSVRMQLDNLVSNYDTEKDLSPVINWQQVFKNQMSLNDAYTAWYQVMQSLLAQPVTM